MKTRIAIALTLLAVLPAAPARAQEGGTGGASYDAPPSAALTVGGLRGSVVRWTGTVSGPGDVRVERLDPASGTWSQVATATAADDGTFTASWPADVMGVYTMRAVRDGEDPAGAPTTRATVYRGARATWYGPGFYGNRLACGGRLRKGMLGVAHKRLKCGTKVALRYNGRTVIAPVIDRGPYHGSREYDLTRETKERLRFGSTGTVWSSPQS